MEELLKYGAYLVTGIVAWFVKIVWGRIEALQERQAEHSLHVSETYVKKEDMKSFSDAIFKKLDKLETLMIGHLTKSDD